MDCGEIKKSPPDRAATYGMEVIVMALFSKESKEEKAARKEQEMLAKYGLEAISDPKDIESIRSIVNELFGTGMQELGMSLSFPKPEVALPIYYQRAILEQNFIIIRQLDRIAKLLEK